MKIYCAHCGKCPPMSTAFSWCAKCLRIVAWRCIELAAKLRGSGINPKLASQVAEYGEILEDTIKYVEED